jgi:hypothetical protein
MGSDSRIIIWFLCKARVSPEGIYARLESEFADATYSERSIRLWCQDVRQGREDLYDEVRSGSPPIDFLDIRIPALLEEQPFHSVYLIAQSVCVSHSTISILHTRLMDLGGTVDSTHRGPGNGIYESNTSVVSLSYSQSASENGHM